jgi:membrane protein implicated in regulation of membrane protease activity
MLSANEGFLDRLIRIVVGLVLLALVFVGPHTPLGWLGLIPLATGIVGYCPLYRLLGINTCPARR